MKKVYVIAIVAATVIFIYASLSKSIMSFDCSYLNFDDTTSNQCITFCNNSIWQIGNPQKIVFTSAYSSPNVIVTDTVNPYPVSDTSCFIIKLPLINYPFLMNMCAGYYHVNCDTLADSCIIELSASNSSLWYNVNYDTTIAWYSNKPVLTGNSYGWKYFTFDPSMRLTYLNVTSNDTMFLRFTFYSDSVQTNKDGIMFDELSFTNVVEGINELEYTRVASKVFPSPTTDKVTIAIPYCIEKHFEVFIFNQTGEKIMHAASREVPVTVNVSNLSAGTYFYETVNETRKIYSAGKFVKLSRPSSLKGH